MSKKACVMLSKMLFGAFILAIITLVGTATVVAYRSQSTMSTYGKTVGQQLRQTLLQRAVNATVAGAISHTQNGYSHQNTSPRCSQWTYSERMRAYYRVCQN